MKKGLLLLIAAFALCACSKSPVMDELSDPQTKAVTIDIPDTLYCSSAAQTVQLSIQFSDPSITWRITPGDNATWQFISVAESNRSGTGSKTVPVVVSQNNGNDRLDSLLVIYKIGRSDVYHPVVVKQLKKVPFSMSPIDAGEYDYPCLWNGQSKDYTITGIDGPLVLTGTNQNIRLTALSISSNPASYFTIATVANKPNVIRLTKRSDMGELGPFDLQFERVSDGEKTAVTKISASRPLIVTDTSSQSKPIYCPVNGQTLIHFTGTTYDDIALDSPVPYFEIAPVPGNNQALYLKNRYWNISSVAQVRFRKKVYGGFSPTVWVSSVRTEPYLDVTPDENTAKLRVDTSSSFTIDPVNGNQITFNIKTNSTSPINVSMTPWSSSDTQWHYMDFMFRGGPEFTQGITYRTSSLPTLDQYVTTKNGTVPSNTTQISFFIPIPHQLWYPTYSRSATLILGIGVSSQTKTFYFNQSKWQ